ncbi:MAG TPA: hypothetical protein VI685_28390 [Candidatus Angelobacter sp.]
MKTLSLIACCSLVALFTGFGFTQNDDLAVWAGKAVSPDQNIAQEAQNHLRAAGPRGLQALETRFAKEISAHKAGGKTPNWTRIGAALDRVGGQYDNYASGLYWYTDLEQAKAAARASGRPILSLRLLGRLDEDLSCANSRFFRTTLYPSAEINQLLKDRFVLHWESVRPAPRVTIDFGDGRKLVRTITGNSIHYILDADGHIVDALPGLYSAQVFVSELNQSADAVKEARAQGSHDYSAHLLSTQARLLRAWAADLATIHVLLPAKDGLTENALEQLMDDQKWQQTSYLPGNRAWFDEPVREVMARKFPTAQAAAPVAESKALMETPMLREMRNLSHSVALDTVRNNYMLRSKILAFLSDRVGSAWTLAEINDWVYATIFLTPGQDPWLGLAPPDVFSAIDKNGESQ